MSTALNLRTVSSVSKAVAAIRAPRSASILSGIVAPENNGREAVEKHVRIAERSAPRHGCVRLCHRVRVGRRWVQHRLLGATPIEVGLLYAIKEYFPRDLAVRTRDGATVQPVNTHAREAFEDGLRRFRDEAEQLRKFRNEPHIVSCVNYCEQNGTAYLVMDYDDGLPLSEFLSRREDQGQPFTEKDLLAVVEPLLAALTVVHGANVLHRDIKPENVFVRRRDDITGRPAHPVLIDFGAAKQNYLERHSRSQAPYTPGYAAYEQTSSEKDIGPCTDLYALGAVMWRIVAGGYPGDSRLVVPDGAENTDGAEVRSPTPRNAEERAYWLYRGRPDPMVSAVELGAGRFSSQVLKAIDECLEVRSENRLQNCEDLQSWLQTQTTSEMRRTTTSAQLRTLSTWRRRRMGAAKMNSRYASSAGWPNSGTLMPYTIWA